MRPGTTRRTFLRGSLGGLAIGLGLPIFDAWLNDAGTAWADGAPLPTRFGTWFWGCGMNPSRFNPTSIGRDFALPQELAPLAPVRDHINVLSGFDVDLDGSRDQDDIEEVCEKAADAMVRKTRARRRPRLARHTFSFN